MGGIQYAHVIVTMPLEFDGCLDAEAVADICFVLTRDSIIGDFGGWVDFFSVVVMLGILDGVGEAIADVNDDTVVVEVLSLLCNFGILLGELLEVSPGEGQRGIVCRESRHLEHGRSILSDVGDHCLFEVDSEDALLVLVSG